MSSLPRGLGTTTNRPASLLLTLGLGSPRTALAEPDEQISPHPPGPTERVWLGSNPKLRQWRLPGMMDDLEDLKPPFAFSQINN